MNTPTDSPVGIDEILNVLVNKWQSNRNVDDSTALFNKAKAALDKYYYAAVLEIIIGDDEERFDPKLPDDLLKLDWQAKNDLRAEQRLRAAKYFGVKK